MRVLLDEDVPVQVLEPLKRVLRGHEVRHLNDLGWKNKKDVFVLHDAVAKGFDVLVTNDAAQLDDPDETDAIKKSGLHHVRYSQRPDLGLHGLVSRDAGSFTLAAPSRAPRGVGEPATMLGIEAGPPPCDAPT